MDGDTTDKRSHRKRPHSDIKPSPSQSRYRDDSRRHSINTSTTATSSAPTQAHQRNSPAERSAFADFHFFDDDDDTPPSDIPASNSPQPKDPVDRRGEEYAIDAPEITSPPRRYKSSDDGLEELMHPSGSPVPERHFNADAKYPLDLGDEASSALGPELKSDIEAAVGQVGRGRERVERPGNMEIRTSGSPVTQRQLTAYAKYLLDLGDEDSSALGPESKSDIKAAVNKVPREMDRVERPGNMENFNNWTELPRIRDSVIARSETPTVSIAARVVGPGHIEDEHPRPKIVDVSHRPEPSGHKQLTEQSDSQEKPSEAFALSKDRKRPGPPSRRLSKELSTRRSSVQQEPQDTQLYLLRNEPLPVAEHPEPESLEATREWLDRLADEESETWSNESVTGFDPVPSESEPPTSSSQRVTGSSETTSSSLTSPEPQPSPKSSPRKPKKPEITRPGTPGPGRRRPRSPSLRRNALESTNPRQPLDKVVDTEDRTSWTLYNIACWTDKGYLKTLLRGPSFKFRRAPHEKSFVEDVSRQMLDHFIGPTHLARLIKDYTLDPDLRHPSDDEEGENAVLIFPESLVESASIMRLVRYMRRCCIRTTVITKPTFQLHAPHALSESIETIRACNIFGLYADARRMQFLLTDKKIPSGLITMDDVETIWEGYNGAFRDSAYTDALLVHYIYNVLGQDGPDKEDFMVLLEQEEYAEFREDVGYELGVKKRKNESREEFRRRKKREREIKRNPGQPKTRVPVTREEKMFLEERGARSSLVRGRLLKKFSLDAVNQLDVTADTRYKTRPRMGRRTVSTPDMIEEGVTGSAGRLYQNALRELKESGSVTDFRRMEEGERQNIGEVPLPPRENIHVKASRNRSPAPDRSIQKVEEQSLLPPRRVPHVNHALARPSAPTPSGRKDRPDISQHTRPPTGIDALPLVPRKNPENRIMSITPRSPISETRRVHQTTPHKPSRPSELDRQRALQPPVPAQPQAYKPPDRDAIPNWRELDAQRADKPFLSDEEYDALLRRSQRPMARYSMDRDQLTPQQREAQEIEAVLLRNATASMTRQKRERARDIVWGDPVQAAAYVEAAGIGRRRYKGREPGPEMVAAKRQSLPAEMGGGDGLALMTRTDPWCDSLGGSTATLSKKKSTVEKLKKAWWEFTHFV